ncbi:hypothetical protein PSACC_00473, partial [Paramicrosporidium saccamoebae]
MSFFALNTDSGDSQYAELRTEFEQVLETCRTDIDSAWKRLSSLLDGELFSAGLAVQPSLRELQRSCLALAYDVGRKVEPTGLVGLSLETVEWFPNEALFWANLADSLNGGYRELVAKRLALKKYTELVPFDRKRKLELDGLGRAIGRTENPMQIPNTMDYTDALKTEPKRAVKIQIELDDGARLGDTIDKICAAAEDALELVPKRRINSHGEDYKAGLVTPVELLFLQNNIPSPMVVEEAELIDDSTLMLSQAGSINNIQDYSQVSTRSRRLRGREQNSSDNRMTIKELVTKLMEIFATLPVEGVCKDALQRAADLQRSGGNSNDSGVQQYEKGVDPRVHSWEALSFSNLGELLQSLASFVLDLVGDEFWSESLASSMLRLARILSTQVEYVLQGANVKVLLWLAESMSIIDPKAPGLNQMIDYLAHCVHVPNVPIPHALRYIWLQYCLTRDVRMLQKLEAVLLSHPLSVPVLGSMTGKACTVINRERISHEALCLKQAACLESAMDKLDSMDGKEWLRDNIDDTSEWLSTSFAVKEFCKLALLISKTASDDSVVINSLLIGVTKCIYTEDPQLTAYLEELCHYPKAFLALTCDAELLEKLANLNHSAEFILCVFSVLDCYSIGSLHPDLALLLWRDFVSPDKAHLKHPKFLTAARALTGSSTTRSSQILKYCALRTIVGAPYLDIHDDIGLAKLLGDDSMQDGRNTIDCTVELFHLANDLVDWELIEAAKALPFLEFICESLKGEFDRHSDLLLAKSTLLSFLKNPNGGQTYSPGHLASLQSPIIAALCQALSIKGPAQKKILTGRKRTIDSIAPLRAEAIIRIVLESDPENRSELFWHLGSLFDNELHLWIAKDASWLLEKSAHLEQLSLGAFISWRTALLECQHVDTVHFTKFIQLMTSIVEGSLSYFATAKVRRLAASALYNVTVKRDEPDWKSFYAKGLVAGWCNKGPALVITLMIKSLQRYQTGDSHNPDIIYSLSHRIVSGLLALIDGNDSVANSPSASHLSSNQVLASRLLAAFLEVSTDCQPPGEGSLRDQLLQLVQQIGKLDKKRVHHSHLYTLARYSSTWSDIKASWGKLIPALVKPKSSQLVAVWHCDLDYPGDHLYYSERYIREGATAIAAASGHAVERATALAILIGRVATAVNLFVKRRSLLIELKNALGQVALVEQNSLAEF